MPESGFLLLVLYKFYNKGPISCHDNASSYPPLLISLHQCLCNTNTIYCHIINPCYYCPIDREMFLIICELIDNLSGSLGGDCDGVDRATGDRLNKMIVGITKGSKGMCDNHLQGYQ